MLANINYKGYTTENLDGLQFSYRPNQCVLKYPNYTIIMFQNGKCRIMGCKGPLREEEELPFKIIVEKIQSVTVTTTLGMTINLQKLAEKTNCMYEPEIFPGLRLIKFNPLCVNVFHSGKLVITGLKTLDFYDIVNIIKTHVLDLIK